MILGCTHFTHIAEEMRQACGPQITVVDSRDGVSRQAIRKISGGSEADSSSKTDGEAVENLSFFVTKADEKELIEYKKLCENVEIPWGGII